jgi:DNA invertase Pin-like site-specific DNA recombinase
VDIVTARRAGVYTRISDDRAGQGLGVNRQDLDCTAMCERLGWEIVDRYVDNDITASQGKRRPNYERLMDDLRSGRIDAVASYHPDRLHRSPKELEHFIDVIESTGAAVATVLVGLYDLSTPSGRLIARTLGAFARYESEHKGERIRRKHLEIAQAGRRPGGGWRPFGFQTDGLTIDPEEAELVREAARRVIAGESIRSICTDWNDRGIPTTTGRTWNQTVMRRLLTAHSTAGLRELRGLVVPAIWPAILDEATWRRTRAVLLDPDRRTNFVHVRRYLLTGFLTCGRCGAKLVARPRSDKRRAYVCARGPKFSGCGQLGVLAEPLEEAVAAVLFARADSPRVVEAIRAQHARADEEDLLSQLAEDEAALEQLARDHYVDKVIGKGQFLAASQGLERRVAATRRRLLHQGGDAVAAGWTGEGGALRTAWPTLNLHQRRAVLQAFVEEIRLGPAVRGRNRFDPDRITPAMGGDVIFRF